MRPLLQDVRFGARMLAKNPGFTAVALLTLALGIGANTAMYSVIHAVVFRPLPFVESQNLVRVYESNQARGLTTFAASAPNYLSWREHARSLELAAFISVARNWTGDGEPERVEGIAATSSLLSVLGSTLQIGRWFTEDEQRPGQHRVIVLSDGFWKARFVQANDVIGRKLFLDGEPHVIVGVARPELVLTSTGPDIWIPRIIDPQENRGNHYLNVIGRLRTGFTVHQARAEMVSIARDLERQFPGSNQGWSAGVVPILDWLIPLELRTTLAVLFAAVGLVTLIACANVANLLLARSEARRKELAIRAALGAGAGRISRQLITESVLLSVGGGALGVTLASSIADIARRSLVGIFPRATQISIDLNVLAFALAVSVITGVLFGLAPLAQLGKMRRLDALHEAGHASHAAPRGRLRAAMVIAQMSLATVLLIGAGLLIQSFARLQAVSLGMEPDPVLTARIPLPGPKYGIGKAYATMLARLTDALRATPGVRAAGVSSAIPLGPGAHTRGSAAAEPSGQSITCEWRSANAGFFESLRVPVLRGRLFGPADENTERRVFVISQAAARSLYGADDPIGRQLRMNNWVGEVIGIVGDLRMRNVANPPERVIYVPISQAGFFAVFSLFVRTEAGFDAGPAAAAALIKERLRELDPNLPAFDVRPMREWVEGNSARARIRTWALALLAAIALAVGAIGIYGVLAYLVTLRRREFGVRLALGADPANLLRLVLAEGLGLAIAGVGAGLAGAMLLTRVLDTLLFGISPRDPLTFVSVTVLLLFVALIACYVPARRAARVNPTVALRYE